MQDAHDAMTKLLDAAADLSDMGGLGALPHPARRAFVDALQKALDGGESMAEVSQRLSELRPDGYLSLAEPLYGFLTSTDGLGIPADDMPQDAMDYLSLVLFLHQEMEAGHLPYRTFAEMGRAAAEGLALADGLSHEDRERIVRMRIAPELCRLWPHDEARVEAEVARLLEG